MNAFKKNTIEIIGIGRTAVYSIGKISITKKGDVYLINKIGSAGSHLSRHKDGRVHYRTKNEEIYKEPEKRIPIKDFEGVEYLGTWAFGIDSLPELYKEYNPRKSNAIVTINMKAFDGLAFNLGIALLSEKGLLPFLEMWKDFKNRQVYISASSNPMVGVVFGAFKKEKT